jgi:UDP-GlcNAc:undecaprenyl-phosphate GlcNAc-1-phosphate transferase
VTTDVVWGVATAVVGGIAAIVVDRIRIKTAPGSLMRMNYRGASVPAVLGDGVVVAGACGVVAAIAMRAAGIDRAPSARLIAAAATVMVVMYLAGSWDDHKGDERPRGFKGHLGAARTGVLTGGIAKLVAGTAAGAAAGALVGTGFGEILTTALLVALTSNAVNLFDRAPGRAAKVGLCGAIVLVVVGPPAWWLVAAGLLGGVAGSLPFDLRESGMLGDAGANPLGAILGLSIAVSLGPTGRAVAVVALAILNLASERWSFSRAIASNPVLDYLDRIGRK